MAVMMKRPAQPSAVFTLPWRGRVGSHRAQREVGRGGVSGFTHASQRSAVLHPTPTAFAALKRSTLPLQGRVTGEARAKPHPQNARCRRRPLAGRPRPRPARSFSPMVVMPDETAAMRAAGAVTLPWRGRVGSHRAQREVSRGGVSGFTHASQRCAVLHPTPTAFAALKRSTLPLQGRVKGGES